MIRKHHQTDNRLQTNNNYITNQQKIEYSIANLHSYDELKNNINNIIESKFNKNTFQSIENVATFITNNLLNCDRNEFYHCFDIKGSIFHKKNGNEIDIDEKAKSLLNDVLPAIIEKSRQIYIEASDDYNDKNIDNDELNKEEENFLMLSKALKNSPLLCLIHHYLYFYRYSHQMLQYKFVSIFQ